MPQRPAYLAAYAGLWALLLASATIAVTFGPAEISATPRVSTMRLRRVTLSLSRMTNR